MFGIKKSNQVSRIKPGPKTKAWEKTRLALKKKFMNWGITSCELRLPGCWGDNALGFAHVDKRRNLKPGELDAVILVCNNCHDKAEYGLKMRETIEKTINARNALLRIRGEVI